jgi:hypothetical protein
MKVGDIFEHWKVLELLKGSKARFVCDCGIEQIKSRRLVVSGTSKSCGCQSLSFRKKTNLEKYGDEFQSRTEATRLKIKNTFITNYGVDNPRKDSLLKEKMKQTKKLRYGEHQEVLVEKRKATMLERYGTEISLAVPEFQQKKLDTMLERFGVAHALQNDASKSKLKKTCLERFGVENPLLVSETQQKARDTLFSRYGVTNPSQSKELINAPKLSNGELVSDKYREYGVPSSTASKVYREYGEEAFLDYCRRYDTPHSSLELRTLSLLKELVPDLEIYNKGPLEGVDVRCRPDFRIEKNGKVLYINVDGLYHHSEVGKSTKGNKNYHLTLRESFESSRIRIMQFREDEIRDKSDIVKSIVANYFGSSTRVGARVCELRRVNSAQASLFFEENHLMGQLKAANSVGLFYKDELIQCLSYRMYESKIEIARFCSKLNTNVSGGFSKLVSYLTKKAKGRLIVSFCDLRYANGISYIKTGFELEGTTLGWNWTDCKNTFNRLKCRANMDDRNLTQAQHAKEFRWIKIYDAGQAKFVLKTS